MAKIGSARIAETGTVHGKAGDQTGREVAEENFYQHKKIWLGFKFKSIEHALANAQAMRDACNNDNIGYDQGSNGNNDRLGVYKQVKKGKKIADIKEPTSADCSGLERACILQATGVDLPNFNTESMPKVLEKSGLFEPPFKVESEDQLEEGMILVTSVKGHTATVTEGKKPTGATSKPIQQPTSTKIQTATSRDMTVSGTYIATSGVTIRSGAGLNFKIVGQMKKGDKCSCWGYYTQNGKIRWIYVQFGDITGFCNMNMLRKL